MVEYSKNLVSFYRSQVILVKQPLRKNALALNLDVVGDNGCSLHAPPHDVDAFSLIFQTNFFREKELGYKTEWIQVKSGLHIISTSVLGSLSRLHGNIV